MKFKQSAIKSMIIAVCLAFASGTFLAGCSDQGPAEEAGENIDDFVEDTQESLEELGEEGEEALEELQEELEEENG